MTRASRFVAAVRKPLSFRPNWREFGSSLGEIAAVGAVSHGCWLIAPAAGWISAGVGLGVVSFALGRDR